MKRPEPFVGQPATIRLFSDTVAAVVVRVNKKSVTVRRVVTGEHRHVPGDGPNPIIVEDGILDQPIGEPERYARIDHPDGPSFRNGSICLTLGRSISRIDYNH